MRRKRISLLHIISSLIFSLALASALDLSAAFFASPVSLAVCAAVLIVSFAFLLVFNISSKWLWLFFFVAIAAALILLTAILFGYRQNISDYVPPENPNSQESIFLKDKKGNTISQHFIDERGVEEFILLSGSSGSELIVSVDNPLCSVKYANNVLTVKCPRNEICVINFATSDGLHHGSASISNPGRFIRKTGPYFNNLFRQFKESNLQQSTTYNLLNSFSM